MLYIHTTTFGIYTLYAWLKVIDEPERFVRHMFLLLHALALLGILVCKFISTIYMNITATY